MCVYVCAASSTRLFQNIQLFVISWKVSAKACTCQVYSYLIKGCFLFIVTYRKICSFKTTPFKLCFFFTTWNELERCNQVFIWEILTFQSLTPSRWLDLSAVNYFFWTMLWPVVIWCCQGQIACQGNGDDESCSGVECSWICKSRQCSTRSREAAEAERMGAGGCQSNEYCKVISHSQFALLTLEHFT